MASTQDIALVRQNIAEADGSGGWTDSRISTFIDALAADGESANLDLVASRIWSVKASEFANIVDVTENGSSRKMSDLFRNAQARATYFSALGETTVIAVADRPRTRPIVRP